MVRGAPPLPLALTMGEPAGVGPDLTLAVWARRKSFRLSPFYCLADPDFLVARARALAIDVPIERVAPHDVPAAFDRALPVVPLDAAATTAAGSIDPTNATAVIEAIARAVGDVRSGVAAAVVTNPINKKSLYDAGFRHPGHTEFLGTLSAAWTGVAGAPGDDARRPELRAVPVTIHIPLRDVADSSERGADRRDRAGSSPPTSYAASQFPGRGSRVAGLNPHAGEGGALGNED